MLNKNSIIEAGLEILQRYGLADLTMRRLAELLNVRAGALYYHVANKQSLLAALSDHILADVHYPDPTLDQPTWLTQWAGALRDAVMGYRDGAEVVASTLAVGLGSTDPGQFAREYLTSHGHRAPDAVVHAVVYFVLGYVTMEQTRSQLQSLGVVETFDAELAARDFMESIEVVVTGASL